MPATIHYAANRLYSFIERNTYLGARSEGASPREAYRTARHYQRWAERRARRG
ncbi:hypothetical protein AB6809_29450 [Paraburkholderia sp. RCC_158]|uniref:hypothetical protein n=1 Tax=Paraburkholderia sp. RCC_158 TaxID=3239220 RepID=UPI00352594D8